MSRPVPVTAQAARSSSPLDLSHVLTIVIEQRHLLLKTSVTKESNDRAGFN